MSAKTAKRRRQQESVEFEEKQRFVVNWVRGHLNKLRREFSRRLKLQRRQFPKMKLPCETCAFRTSADFTDGDDGFLRTSLSFVHAMATGAPFYCHEPKKPGDDDQYRPRFNEKLKLSEPCAGWVVLYSTTPETLDIRRFLGNDEVSMMVDCHNMIREKDVLA